MTAPHLTTGAALPAIEKSMTAVDLMAYGAATWDWYACHYNDAAAQKLGIRAAFVDGQMWGAWFARQLRAHFGTHAFVTRMQLRYHAMVFVGDDVSCQAEIASIKERDGFTIYEVRHMLSSKGMKAASCISELRVPSGT